MPTPANIIAMLERTDKWYLGGGKATLYAPAFPRFLDTPGFWDEVYFADIRLERLYCLLALDEQGRPFTLRRALRRWTPDRLVTFYTVEGHPTLRIQEERVVTPNDTLACRFTFTNSGSQFVRLHLLLWSLQARNAIVADRFSTSVADINQDLDGFTFAHRLHYGGRGETPAEVHGWGERPVANTEPFETEPFETEPFETEPFEKAEPETVSATTKKEQKLDPQIYVALGGSRLAESWTLNFAEATDNAPLWQSSVFPEAFRNGTLPRQRQDLPFVDNSTLCGYPETSQAVSTGRSGNEQDSHPNNSNAENSNAEEQREGHLHLALHYVLEAQPGGSDGITVGASVALSREQATAQLREDMAGDVVASSRASWETYFASLPHFECDDIYLERYYWYRWYGLRLLTVDLGAEEVAKVGGHLPHPCIFEGIGAFRSHVSYSAQCHIRETAWMPDRRIAMGSLFNFIEAQIRDDTLRDGFVPGHLYLWRQDRGFYHTNWGAAALQLYHLTGDLDLVASVYAPLSRYAEYFERERDREGIHLYDVQDQGETGQEYTSRYLFVDPNADSWQPIQIKGVDATCYLFELQRTLAVFAHALGKQRDARWWDGKADATRDAVRRSLWDPEAALFKDADPETLEVSPYLAAVGFYPFLSEIGTRAHLTAWQHLGDPETFGTPYPVPSSSANDPYFDAQGYWRGRRTNCPWNGRVWPMTNSHLVDALANSARTLDSRLQPMAVDLLLRFVRMLFHEGDPKRPNSYEHYNPETGTPSLYRGIDDYQHSWIVDLILRHVVGIQPTPGHKGSLIVDPLLFPLRRFRCDNVWVRGHRVDVSWSQDNGFVVRIDGQEAARLPERERIELPLG